VTKFKILFFVLTTSITTGCVNIDKSQTNYKFDDKSSLHAIRWQGVVKQDLDFSCGIASIATVLKYHFGEKNINERDLLRGFVENLTDEELSEVFKKGASLAQLGDIFLGRGFTIRNWRLEIKDLKELSSVLPIIVYLEKPDFKHFAVIKGVSDFQVFLADPSRGNVKLTIGSFLEEWKGRRALLVARNQTELKKHLLQVPKSEEAEARFEMLHSIINTPKQF